jgi:hypothetical protein
MSCDGVELEFPGLDRFESMPRSTDPEDEDVHHNRTRMLGAKWGAMKMLENEYEANGLLRMSLKMTPRSLGGLRPRARTLESEQKMLR